MFHIVLVHPEIPPNTGNVIRLAANTGCSLHLVEPLGFRMEDRLLQARRSGLSRVHRRARHASWQSWLESCRPDPTRCFAFSTRGSADFATARWQRGDWLVFGSESAGLPQELLAHFAPAQRLRLPMRAGQRSLNLSNAVAVAVFEAWRQQGYAGSG